MEPQRVGRGATPRKKWGPKGGAPEGWEAKISRFFFNSHHNVHPFFPLLGGCSREILVVFEAPGPSNVHVGRTRPVLGRAVGEGG